MENFQTRFEKEGFSQQWIDAYERHFSELSSEHEIIDSMFHGKELPQEDWQLYAKSQNRGSFFEKVFMEVISGEWAWPTKPIMQYCFEIDDVYKNLINSGETEYYATMFIDNLYCPGAYSAISPDVYASAAEDALFHGLSIEQCRIFARALQFDVDEDGNDISNKSSLDKAKYCVSLYREYPKEWQRFHIMKATAYAFSKDYKPEKVFVDRFCKEWPITCKEINEQTVFEVLENVQKVWDKIKLSHQIFDMIKDFCSEHIEEKFEDNYNRITGEVRSIATKYKLENEDNILLNTKNTLIGLIATKKFTNIYKRNISLSHLFGDNDLSVNVPYKGKLIRLRLNGLKGEIFIDFSCVYIEDHDGEDAFNECKPLLKKIQKKIPKLKKCQYCEGVALFYTTAQKAEKEFIELVEVVDKCIIEME